MDDVSDLAAVIDTLRELNDKEELTGLVVVAVTGEDAGTYRTFIVGDFQASQVIMAAEIIKMQILADVDGGEPDFEECIEKLN